jgi:hypothetical protein
MHLPYAQPWPANSASRFVRDEEVHRTVVGPCDARGQNFFTLSDAMPR